MGESLVGHIPRKENVADSMTKFLYGQNVRCLVSNIVFDIHDDHQQSVLARTECNKQV